MIIQHGRGRDSRCRDSRSFLPLSSTLFLTSVLSPVPNYTDALTSISQATWEGPNDRAIPQNWSLKRRWLGTLAVSAFSLVASVSSSIIAPCLPAIAAEFQIKNDVEVQLCLSSFVLAWAIGPLFLGPLSEMYGRIAILQASNVIYLIFNLACGFTHSSTQLIVFRLISGLGASAPTAVSTCSSLDFLSAVVY